MEDKYYEISAIVVITALAFGAVMVILPYPLFSNVPAEGTAFVIEKGESLGAIAHSLADQNLLVSRYLFVAYAIFIGQEKNFKAGKYTIPSPVSIKELVGIFSEGRAEPDDITVVVPEGTNIADIGRILTKAGLVGAGDFLKPEILAEEGYLFPNTYRLRNYRLPTTNSQQPAIAEIIGKMRENFEEKTVELFEGLDAGKIQRMLIIASMLEKEVKTERDMKLVAGIIEKRLSQNMPLEIDATVTYSVCYPKFLAGEYCDVSIANIADNLNIDSPYNTYKSKDLPPAPISNPGLAAIEAALNPEPSDYLYYLSAKDGTTIFSRTAAEHERAKNKYLK